MGIFDIGRHLPRRRAEIQRPTEQPVNLPRSAAYYCRE
jgi:hypothetical protein